MTLLGQTVLARPWDTLIPDIRISTFNYVVHEWFDRERSSESRKVIYVDQNQEYGSSLQNRSVRFIFKRKFSSSKIKFSSIYFIQKNTSCSFERPLVNLIWNPDSLEIPIFAILHPIPLQIYSEDETQIWWCLQGGEVNLNSVVSSLVTL